jgi:hypothetical protein
LADHRRRALVAREALAKLGNVGLDELHRERGCLVERVLVAGQQPLAGCEAAAQAFSSLLPESPPTRSGALRRENRLDESLSRTRFNAPLPRCFLTRLRGARAARGVEPELARLAPSAHERDDWARARAACRGRELTASQSLVPR